MKKIFLYIAVLFFIFFNSCKVQKKKYILDENFDSNTIGWTEESTKAHHTEIMDGYYYIQSIDTSKDQTSAGPLNRSFLWNCPKKYEINSSFQSIGNADNVHFGIILSSPSLEYKFFFSDLCKAGLKEWDSNRETDSLLFIKQSDHRFNIKSRPVDFKIRVDNSKFEYYINGELFGEGEFHTKQWDGIRLFTTSGSEVKIDYLRFKEIE